MTGVLRIKTTKEFGESTVSKILELVEIPVPGNPNPRTLFQNLREFIHQRYATALWRWQCFPLWYRCCFGAERCMECLDLSCADLSWLSVVPVRWLLVFRSAFSPVLAEQARQGC